MVAALEKSFPETKVILIDAAGSLMGKSDLQIHGCELSLFIRSVMSDSATSRTATCQASLSLTVSQTWLKLMSTESMIPSNHLILCHLLLLLPSNFLSIRMFSTRLQSKEERKKEKRLPQDDLLRSQPLQTPQGDPRTAFQSIP